MVLCISFGIFHLLMDVKLHIIINKTAKKHCTIHKSLFLGQFVYPGMDAGLLRKE